MYDPAAEPSMDVPIQRKSGLGSFSFSLVGVVGLLALVIAGATVWLLLTDPVTVAESVDSGEVSPLVQSLAGSIYDALVQLLKYLYGGRQTATGRRKTDRPTPRGKAQASRPKPPSPKPQAPSPKP